ncbi:hypothetical protein BJ546DRAFT_585764 [Cryomyces antarcticus]
MLPSRSVISLSPTSFRTHVLLSAYSSWSPAFILSVLAPFLFSQSSVRSSHTQGLPIVLAAPSARAGITKARGTVNETIRARSNGSSALNNSAYRTTSVLPIRLKPLRESETRHFAYGLELTTEVPLGPLPLTTKSREKPYKTLKKSKVEINEDFVAGLEWTDDQGNPAEYTPSNESRTPT